MLEAFCHVRSCRWVNPSHMIHTWLSTKFSGMYPHVYNFILNWSHLGLQLSAFSSLNSTITTFSYAFSIMNNMLFAGYLRYMYYVYVVLPLIHLNYYFIKCNEQWAMIKQASEKQKIYLQNKWDIHIAVIPNTHAALIPHTVDIWVKYPR